MRSGSGKLVTYYAQFVEYTLEQIYRILGERDFKLRLSNHQYIVILTKENVEIGMIMNPMIVGGQPQLIHNPKDYVFTIKFEEKILSIYLSKDLVFQMNFDSYSLEIPRL
jgi:hypothetical protein